MDDIDWLEDLLDRYRLALELLNKQPANIQYATRPHRQAITSVRNKLYKPLPKKEPCVNCGELYQKGRTARKDAKFCSTRCRMAAHRRKKIDA